jgi:hypothetical protein
MTLASTAEKLLRVASPALTLLVAGCGGGGHQALPTGSEHVDIDPASFSSTIDNPYWPMRVGTRWTYRETDDEGGRRTVVVTVTPQTRTILGVETRVVHDVVGADGGIVEDTRDWYAQDADGNVWYFGEQTTEYEQGKPPSTAGSWEAGVDGAEPGIAMPAHPRPGLSYRQEYSRGEAEDAAEVLSLDEKVEVPLGFFTNVLLTRDVTTLDPKVSEHKFYARGIGPLLEIGISGGTDKAVLLSRGSSR